MGDLQLSRLLVCASYSDLILLAQRQPSLVVLHLDCSSITTTHANPMWSPDLYITDIGIRALAEQQMQLEDLSLANCMITTRGLMQIGASLTNLKALKISGEASADQFNCATLFVVSSNGCDLPGSLLSLCDDQ